MKINLISLATLLALAISAPAQDKIRPLKSGDLSLKNEIQLRIDKALGYLIDQQKEDGSWGDEQLPALTALPVMAITGDPSRDPESPLPEAAEKAYDYLLGVQKRDGGIYVKGLGTYNTSLSLTALLMAGNRPGHEEAIREARKFLINLQADYDKKGVADDELDGGIGYGGSYSHSDLSNTHFAIEALHYAKQYLADRPQKPEFELDWDAAIQFVSRCQNLEETNDLTGKWLAVREEDRGGFVYFPGDSKAGEVEVSEEKVALRSYGSMTYAGLLSFIYADMDQNDPRVVAAKDWLSKNYTVDENPGMDAQGMYYYFHTMAKVLALLGNEKFELADGTEVDWREKLALKLFDTQQPDGSWINEGSSRWMEDDPILVTSYSILALEHIARQL